MRRGVYNIRVIGVTSERFARTIGARVADSRDRHFSGSVIDGARLRDGRRGNEARRLFRGRRRRNGGRWRKRDRRARRFDDRRLRNRRLERWKLWLPERRSGGDGRRRVGRPRWKLWKRGFRWSFGQPDGG